MGRVIADKLGLEMSDINGNEGFVQLGGDSLKAMSVAANLRRRGKHLSNRHIMLSQTHKSMARLLTSRDNSDSKDLVPAPFSLLQPGVSRTVRWQAAEACGVKIESVREVFPCTALQEGFLGVSSRESRANVARYVFKLEPKIDIEEVALDHSSSF